MIPPLKQVRLADGVDDDVGVESRLLIPQSERNRQSGLAGLNFNDV